jgi:peptidoglycan hydrolase-like protein with peptidoglycan-binding domain
MTMAVGTTRIGFAVFAVLIAGVVANVMNQPTQHARVARAAPQSPAAPPLDIPTRTVETASVVGPKAGKDGRPLPEVDAMSSSDLVRAIQRELQARGYEPGAQDGVPGLVTRAAIYAYEEDLRVTPTGEPSEPLLKALLLGSTPSPSRASSDPRGGAELIVRAVQQHLGALGYHPRRPDGRVAADTIRAIREFELDQGMKPSGRITGPLMARLLKASATGARPASASR